MVVDAGEHALEREHVIVGDPDIVPFYRRQEVQVRPFLQLPFDLAGRESFAGDNDSPADVVITNESGIGTGIDAVAGEHFRADRLHCLDVIGIEHGDFLTAFPPRLVRKGRQVIYCAAVLFERPVNCDMVAGNDSGGTLLVKSPASAAVLPELLQESADGIRGQCCPRVVLADKCASIVRSHTVSRDGWAYDPERGNCHYSACVLCGIDIQKVSQDIGRNGFRKCGCPIR